MIAQSLDEMSIDHIVFTWKQNFGGPCCFVARGSCKKSLKFHLLGYFLFPSQHGQLLQVYQNMSTIEISSMIKFLQRLHCWAWPGQDARSTHWARSALPLPIPVMHNTIKNNQIFKTHQQKFKWLHKTSVLLKP